MVGGCERVALEEMYMWYVRTNTLKRRAEVLSFSWWPLRGSDSSHAIKNDTQHLSQVFTHLLKNIFLRD